MRVPELDPELQRIVKRYREIAASYDAKEELLRAEGRNGLAGEYERAARSWRREAGKIERGEAPQYGLPSPSEIARIAPDA